MGTPRFGARGRCPPPHWGRPAEGRRRPPRCESETGAAQKGPWRQMGTLLPLSPPRAQWWPWHLRGSRGGGVGGQHWGGSVAPPCVPPAPISPCPHVPYLLSPYPVMSHIPRPRVPVSSVPTSPVSLPHILLSPRPQIPSSPYPEPPVLISSPPYPKPRVPVPCVPISRTPNLVAPSPMSWTL